MLLIADSGSTKADWMLADNGKVVASFSTIGFNPLFHSSEFILQNLSASGMKKYAEKISEIKFFGAGVSSPRQNNSMKETLQTFFSKANVSVESDMKAAALATCGNEKGIVAILGTGSNVCYYDGTRIHSNNFSLGYILGDEASGSFFGKKILTHYLYGFLPTHLHAAFEKKFQMTKAIAIENVYRKQNANVYLSSFCKFLSAHKEDAYVQNILRNGFKYFLEMFVMHIPDFEKLPVHFVGSVAFHFQDTLRQVAAEKNISVGKILQKPIAELTEHFLRKNIQE